MISSVIYCVQKQSNGAFKELTKSKTVRLVSEESFFHEFFVDGQTVALRCALTLKNTSNETKSVYLYAYSPKDRSRLIKDGKLFAVDEEDKMVLFTIPPQATMVFEEMYFKGEFGGTKQKFNRLLPDILIVEQPQI